MNDINYTTPTPGDAPGGIQFPEDVSASSAAPTPHPATNVAPSMDIPAAPVAPAPVEPVAVSPAAQDPIASAEPVSTLSPTPSAGSAAYMMDPEPQFAPEPASTYDAQTAQMMTQQPTPGESQSDAAMTGATDAGDAKANNHILVAEDDIFISDIYDVKLTSAGYRVEIAHNGREALEKLRAGLRPNLMLLDIVMPYVDGFDVLEEYAKHPEWQDIPIVLLTNLSQKEDIDRAMERGARDYLIKSHFTPTEVLSKVEKYIRKD